MERSARVDYVLSRFPISYFDFELFQFQQVFLNLNDNALSRWIRFHPAHV